MSKRRTGKGPIMIVLFNECLSIPPEDKKFSKPTVPYYCPRCTWEYDACSRILRLTGNPIPECLDHDSPVTMLPVKR